MHTALNCTTHAQLPSYTAIAVDIDIYGWTTWTLRVEPEGGFDPHWLPGLLVGVTALSLILSGGSAASRCCGSVSFLVRVWCWLLVGVT